MTAAGPAPEPAPTSPSTGAEPLKFSVNNLDLIRLIAAADVAIKHGLVHLEVGQDWAEWLGLFPGVPIFFFISGFLIYRSYRNAPDLGTFAANRFLRLFPGLLVCLVLSVALLIATGYLPARQLLSADFWVWVAAQLTLLQFYNWDALRGFGVGVVNGSLWTISVELQFYLLTPIVAWLVARRAKVLPALIVLFALANVAFGLLDKDSTLGKLVMVTFVPWVYMFLAGAWIATRDDVLRRVVALPWLWLLAAYAVALIVSVAVGVPYLGNYVSPLLFVPFCALVLKSAYVQPQLAHRILGRNDISYGVYIYHMPIINGLMFYGLVGAPAWLVVAMGLTFVMAALSWFLIERPALARKRTTLRRVGSSG